MKIIKKFFLILALTLFMSLIPVKQSFAFTISLNSYYYLQSALDNNKVIDVKNASKKNGANIQLYKKNGTEAQLFKIVKSGNGFYAFINKKSKKAIDVYGAYTYSGANVNQWDQNNSSAQQWKIYHASGYPDGYVRIKNACGKYLDVSGASTKNRTNIQIWDRNGTNAQVFKLVPYIQTSYVTVTLKSFSNLDQWKKQMQYAEQKAVGFSRVSYNLSGNLTNYGKMIVGKTVLKYKTIKVTYYEYGVKKNVKVKLPSKVKFKLHKHNIKQKVWFDFSNLTLTQTCTCGEWSQVKWEIPYPSEDFLNHIKK